MFSTNVCVQFFAVATHMNTMPAQPYIFRNYRYVYLIGVWQASASGVRMTLRVIYLHFVAGTH